MDRQFDAIDKRFDGIDQRFDGIDGRLDGVDHRLGDLDRHMHVLHEDVIARIAAIPEYSGPTKAEFAELKEMIGRRLDPLEVTVRHHTVEIERLKKTRNRR